MSPVAAAALDAVADVTARRSGPSQGSSWRRWNGEDIRITVAGRAIRGAELRSTPSQPHAHRLTYLWTPSGLIQRVTPTWSIANALVVIAVIAALSGWPAFVTPTKANTFAITVALFASDGALLASLFAIAVRHRNLRWSDLGLRAPPLRWLLAAIPAALLMLDASGLIASLLHGYGSSRLQCIATRDALAQSPLPIALDACLLTPATEELVFRGYIFAWLRERIPIVAAIVISAVVFGIAHVIVLGVGGALPIVAVGIVLATLYHYSGSLLPGMCAHALYNSFGLIAILQTPHC